MASRPTASPGPAGATADDIQIVPFRGESYELRTRGSNLVHALIYPIPDPAVPVPRHPPDQDDRRHVHVGPNAVLALAHEGYDWRHWDRHDLAEMATFPGLRTLGKRYWRYGAHEVVRSLSRRSFTKALQQLVPEVQRSDLRPSPAGVRLQALLADGTLVDDFLLREDGRALHVLNAPSPAATASRSRSASVIAERVDELWPL